MATVTSSRLLALYAISPRVYPPAPIVLTADTPVTGIGTLGTINSTSVNAAGTANAALTTANNAFAGLSNKLSNGAATVMTSGFALKTPNYDAGYGMVFYDGGLISKWGGAIKYVFDAQSGSQTFTGTLDCGNGAIIRTEHLASAGTVDLVKMQLPNGAQFGALQQGDIMGYGQTGAAGWNFNFSGQAFAALGAVNTSTGAAGKLIVSSAGKGYLGVKPAGGLWAWPFIAVCDATQQAGLNADMVDGYHAGNNYGGIPIANGILASGLNAEMVGGIRASGFAYAGHNHSGVYSPVGHAHTFWAAQTFGIDLYNAAGTTYVGSYQVRITSISNWWTYSTST